MTSIGYQAFDYCGSLTSVHIKRYVPGGSPEITQLATYKAFFHGPSAGRTIYVPTAAVAAYKADAEWGYLETAELGTIQGE